MDQNTLWKTLNDIEGLQIYRTYAEKEDSTYIIGIFSINMDPDKENIPKRIEDSQDPKFLMNGNDRFYKRAKLLFFNQRSIKENKC
jgi:hypothetical protein